MPAMCPFTKLHEIDSRRATSASQFGPILAAGPALLLRHAILPDNRQLRAVHPNWCVRRRATSDVCHSIGPRRPERVSARVLQGAWEVSPIGVPSFVQAIHQDIHHLQHLFVVTLSVLHCLIWRECPKKRGPAHCERICHAHWRFGTLTALVSNLCTNSGDPIGVPKILMPVGFQTSSPRLTTSGGHVPRDSTPLAKSGHLMQFGEKSASENVIVRTPMDDKIVHSGSASVRTLIACTTLSVPALLERAKWSAHCLHFLAELPSVCERQADEKMCPLRFFAPRRLSSAMPSWLTS